MDAQRQELPRVLAAMLALASACACACTPAFAAQDEQVVEIEREGGVFRIHINTPVAADVATAWQVLTDYDRLAEFVPDMRASHAIRTPGRPLRLEQYGKGRVLFFTAEINVTFELEETPPDRLVFQAVAGDMKHMHGNWLIRRAPDGVELIYDAELEPSFWVPPLIGGVLVRHNVLAGIDGIAREMARRYAARDTQKGK